MTFTFDPLTLDFCGRSGIMMSIYMPNFSEVCQSAAELLMINDRFFVRFRGCCNSRIGILKMHGLICTKFGVNIVRSSLHTKLNKKLCYRKDDSASIVHSSFSSVSALFSASAVLEGVAELQQTFS